MSLFIFSPLKEWVYAFGFEFLDESESIIKNEINAVELYLIPQAIFGEK